MIKTVKKRRKQRKTDYKIRLNLLKSGIPRIVIRKTNKYIIIQEVISKEARDKVIFGLTSRDLIEYGWPKEGEGSLKSIAAAYLTGYLAGKKISEKEGKKSFIIDLGLQRNVHGSRIFASIKGLIDGGLKINADSKAFPSEKRIKESVNKEDIKKNFDKIKLNIK
ncbi:MAG TPA: 50S ribosomal protein L18 [Candidatus Paceibacterota bacterium]|nr:50S ribosomal protein L18 [Candidatus Paceibacterota bacterium]